ncbi:MAG: hypothetical protein LBV00_04415 [Propionibacteriaceae bacterium]|jgi:hypothetical protein|nr:hypothetical protein [Propionibacteriaceae bacterium]
MDTVPRYDMIVADKRKHLPLLLLADEQESMIDHYRHMAAALMAGTGDSPLTVPFYEANGFRFHHRVPRGIADTYDHPIVGAGVQVIDKVYFSFEYGGGGRTNFAGNLT